MFALAGFRRNTEDNPKTAVTDGYIGVFLLSIQQCNTGNSAANYFSNLKVFFFFFFIFNTYDWNFSFPLTTLLYFHWPKNWPSREQTVVYEVLSHPHPSQCPISWYLTISDQLQQSQVKRPFPAGVLVQGDAIARSGKHLTGADGHDLVEYTETCRHPYIYAYKHMNPYTKSMSPMALMNGNQPDFSCNFSAAFMQLAQF